MHKKCIGEACMNKEKILLLMFAKATDESMLLRNRAMKDGNREWKDRLGLITTKE